ncbi:MAG TPA: hypothetical protein VGL38_15460 [bacterium]|jgi:hypothetical protein
MKRTMMVMMVISLVVAGAAFAAVPQKISYQGVLTNASGVVVPDGNYDLTLSLYDTLSGGTALWTEAQLTAVSHGIFNVVLGSVVPITKAFDKPLFLGVAVAGGAELSPRTLLTASPYSLNAPVMGFVSSSATTTISTGWTNYEDEQLTLYCPGPGYVVVHSTAWLQINHVQGTSDRVQVTHDTTATGQGPDYDMISTYLIATDEPTQYQDVTLPVQTVVPVAAAGTYTFYLNGQMLEGQDTADHFWYAGTTATWYPATAAAATAAAMRSHHPQKSVEKAR